MKRITDWYNWRYVSCSN